MLLSNRSKILKIKVKYRKIVNFPLESLNAKLFCSNLRRNTDGMLKVWLKGIPGNMLIPSLKIYLLRVRNHRKRRK